MSSTIMTRKVERCRQPHNLKLLELDRTFRMADIIFTISDSTFRCITSTTIKKENKNHQLTVMVQFMTSNSQNW
ncbi:hypothetical protein V5799_028374 [Amblyomma americanum]|uniref:Uncharacterized protein n=1 Tax=Amblyomma americanum TaxID=6943 RepID=A0AAQ4DD19_AMBAM